MSRVGFDGPYYMGSSVQHGTIERAVWDARCNLAGEIISPSRSLLADETHRYLRPNSLPAHSDSYISIYSMCVSSARLSLTLSLFLT